MPRVLLALSLMFFAPACQKAQASKAGPSARDQQVAARLDDLDRQIHRIRAGDQRLGRQAQTVAARVASLGHRLESLAAVLGNLRHKVGSLDSASADAVSRADTAAAQASELARRLAVLEKRFEYHLKNHGGQ